MTRNALPGQWVLLAWVNGSGRRTRASAAPSVQGGQSAPFLELTRAPPGD